MIMWPILLINIFFFLVGQNLYHEVKLNKEDNEKALYRLRISSSFNIIATAIRFGTQVWIDSFNLSLGLPIYWSYAIYARLSTLIALAFIWYSNVDIEHRYVIYLMCLTNLFFLHTVFDLIRLRDSLAPLMRILN